MLLDILIFLIDQYEDLVVQERFELSKARLHVYQTCFFVHLNTAQYSGDLSLTVTSVLVIINLLFGRNQ